MTTEIRYVVGDATQPIGEGAKLIAHVCNDVGAFGAGVAKAIKQRWPFAAEVYHDWHRGGAEAGFELGKVQIVDCLSNPRPVLIVNMIAQHGLRSAKNPKPIGDYTALRSCLNLLADVATRLGVGVHMPRIGCGLAGGTWSQVEPIVVEELCRRGVSVTVYDLPKGM